MLRFSIKLENRVVLSLLTFFMIVSGQRYVLLDDYTPSTFQSFFTWDNSYDKTNGHVQYVNETIAIQNGMFKQNPNSVYIGADYTGIYPNGGPGRPSTRMVGTQSYNKGLFIADITHMPAVCGAWPAYWLTGPNWPNSGEIDIVEGANLDIQNSMALHTSLNCTIAGSHMTGTLVRRDCAYYPGYNAGCGVRFNSTASWGKPFNDNGGGIYATEWTSNWIKTWFFPRDQIPATIANNDPNPNISSFGLPSAAFQGNCDFDSKFKDNHFVINIDFCGDWAGNTYASTTCPKTVNASGWDSCVNFVGNNPSNFTEAYWEFQGIKVYQQDQPVSSIVVPPPSSVSPLPSSDTILPPGMGGAASDISGSLTPPSVVFAPASSSVPLPSGVASCPSGNQTYYTSPPGALYIIECGWAHTGEDLPSPNWASVASLAACIDLCDLRSACVLVSWNGVCYLKGSVGGIVYSSNVAAARQITAGSGVMSASAITSTLMASSTPVFGQSPTTSVVMLATTSSVPAPSSALTAVISQLALVSSVSSASAVASSTSNLENVAPVCPQSNNTIYSSNNGQWLIECGINHGSCDMSGTGLDAATLQVCVDRCALRVGCIYANWYSGKCYEKSCVGAISSSALGQGGRLLFSTSSSSVPVAQPSLSLQSLSSPPPLVIASSAPLMIGSSNIGGNSILSLNQVTLGQLTPASAASIATLPSPVPVSCPSSNETIYTTVNGTFRINCGINYVGFDIAGYGEFEPSYQACVDKCSTVPACLAVTYFNGNCYLKSGLGSTALSANANSAFLITRAVVSSNVLYTTSATIVALQSSTIASLSASLGVIISPSSLGNNVLPPTLSSPQSSPITISTAAAALNAASSKQITAQTSVGSPNLAAGSVISSMIGTGQMVSVGRTSTTSNSMAGSVYTLSNPSILFSTGPLLPSISSSGMATTSVAAKPTRGVDLNTLLSQGHVSVQTDPKTGTTFAELTPNGTSISVTLTLPVNGTSTKVPQKLVFQVANDGYYFGKVRRVIERQLPTGCLLHVFYGGIEVSTIDIADLFAEYQTYTSNATLPSNSNTTIMFNETCKDTTVFPTLRIANVSIEYQGLLPISSGPPGLGAISTVASGGSLPGSLGIVSSVSVDLSYSVGETLTTPTIFPSSLAMPGSSITSQLRKTVTITHSMCIPRSIRTIFETVTATQCPATCPMSIASSTQSLSATTDTCVSLCRNSCGLVPTLVTTTCADTIASSSISAIASRTSFASGGSSATPNCPFEPNQRVFYDPMGKTYVLSCGMIYDDPDVGGSVSLVKKRSVTTLEGQIQAATFLDCIMACDDYNFRHFSMGSPCKGVSFFEDGGAQNCHLKASVNLPRALSGIDSARLVTLDQPPSNNTLTTTTTVLTGGILSTFYTGIGGGGLGRGGGVTDLGGGGTGGVLSGGNGGSAIATITQGLGTGAGTNLGSGPGTGLGTGLGTGGGGPGGGPGTGPGTGLGTGIGSGNGSGTGPGTGPSPTSYIVSTSVSTTTLTQTTTVTSISTSVSTQTNTVVSTSISVSISRGLSTTIYQSVMVPITIVSTSVATTQLTMTSVSVQISVQISSIPYTITAIGPTITAAAPTVTVGGGPGGVVTVTAAGPSSTIPFLCYSTSMHFLRRRNAQATPIPTVRILYHRLNKDVRRDMRAWENAG